MKKLNKKKLLLFGLLPLLIIGIATALLVSHLSNTITASVEVDNPLEM